MAEFYFMATGPLMWLKRFETELESAKWWIPYLTPDGRTEQIKAGGLIEPLQLYRFICSEQSMPLFQRTLMRNHPKKTGISGLPTYALRKALGLQEPPEDGLKSNWKEGPVLDIPMDHIHLIPVGYKPDDNRILTTGVTQELV